MLARNYKKRPICPPSIESIVIKSAGLSLLGVGVHQKKGRNIFYGTQSFVMTYEYTLDDPEAVEQLSHVIAIRCNDLGLYSQSILPSLYETTLALNYDYFF